MAWNVSIETSTDEPVEVDALDDLLTILEDYDAVVITPPEEPRPGEPVRYGANVTIADGAPPEYAVNAALELFREAAMKAGLPRGDIARIELVSDAILDAELAEPNFPILLGVSELAELLHVSRQRASELARSESFPRPVVELASGPVWAEPMVRRHLEHWPRRPGRPRKSDDEGLTVSLNVTLEEAPKGTEK